MNLASRSAPTFYGRAVPESAGGGVVVVVASNGLAASAPVVYACGGGEGVAVVPGCEFGVSEVIRIQRRSK